MYEVRDRAVIITGSARGFGKEYAIRLLRLGAKVCLSDVMEDAGQETAKELAREFGETKVLFVKCDVASEEDWDNLWKKAEDKFGYIHVLINNAGVNPNVGWKKCLEIMLWGQFIGTHIAMDKMTIKKGGKGGRIINTASIAGMITSFGGTELAGYQAAKFGNIAFTRLFASSNPKVPNMFETDGIKSYAICPNLANTRLLGSDEDVKDMEKFVEFRALTIEEVGEALVQAIRQDKNGACYAVHPDVPLLEVPNGTEVTVIWFIIVGKLLRLMNINVDVLRPGSALAFTALVALALLYFLQWVIAFLI